MKLAPFLSGLFLIGLAGPGMASENILVLTDSHGIGPVGRALSDELRQRPGARVEMFAIGAAQPMSFVRGFTTPCGRHTLADESGIQNLVRLRRRQMCTRLAAPLARHVVRGRDAVVLVLGTNLINDSRGPSYARMAIQRLAEIVHVSGARCFWVGPPGMRRFSSQRIDSIYASLKEVLHPADSPAPLCELIDSRPFAQYPASGGDGVHYWRLPELGRHWGQSVGALISGAF